MEFPFQAILFLGIIPALALLFFALKGYDGFYKDKTIFLAFVVGIIIGVVVAVTRYLIYFLPLVYLFIILFAFFEQLFKTIVLNIGRFHRKKEVTIYGLTLGLGFGSSFTPFLILSGAITEDATFTMIGFIFVGAIGFTLFHAATAAYIGYGIYLGKLFKYLFLAILVQIPFNLIFDLAKYTKDPFFVYYQIGLLIYGAICYFYIVKYVMPNILKDTGGRKRSKKTK
jgi:hypothetical protein